MAILHTSAPGDGAVEVHVELAGPCDHRWRGFRFRVRGVMLVSDDFRLLAREPEPSASEAATMIQELTRTAAALAASRARLLAIDL